VFKELVRIFNGYGTNTKYNSNIIILINIFIYIQDERKGRPRKTCVGEIVVMAGCNARVALKREEWK